MAVADAVISFAVQKTGDLILQQAKYLTEVCAKVQELRAELTRMRCFFRDADSRQGDSRSIHNWVAEIRDIAYDAEDILEIYALKDASRSIFSRCGIRWRDPISAYKVGAAIDGIAARLTKLTTRLPAYGLKELRMKKEREALQTKNSIVELILTRWNKMWLGWKKIQIYC
ncbi:hypothetical protein V6N12_066096 [Hibiscus sabdariffa]|uniref:Disease resistance N-terminal domain-containing protein n=1 Tax=Hibiscus sabdariffa TaxID=183260 RepID=A0ABR2AQH0_9ROSI